jgi:hypothetical protein
VQQLPKAIQTKNSPSKMRTNNSISRARSRPFTSTKPPTNNKRNCPLTSPKPPHLVQKEPLLLRVPNRQTPTDLPLHSLLIPPHIQSTNIPTLNIQHQIPTTPGKRGGCCVVWPSASQTATQPRHPRNVAVTQQEPPNPKHPLYII